MLREVFINNFMLLPHRYKYWRKVLSHLWTSAHWNNSRQSWV